MSKKFKTLLLIVGILIACFLLIQGFGSELISNGNSMDVPDYFNTPSLSMLRTSLAAGLDKWLY